MGGIFTVVIWFVFRKRQRVIARTEVWSKLIQK
ncbi:hypothetical protein I1A59_08755 [Streptococcus mitis]|nr:hypothetical protein [Streptococcus sp. NLN76]MBG9367932.1 hypothetical protein [Streptococcus sp. NLN64]